MGGENGLTVGIVIAPKADHNEALLLREDSLVNMPGSSKVRQYDRTHGGVANEDQRSASSRKLESSELIAGPAIESSHVTSVSFGRPTGLQQLDIGDVRVATI